MKMREIKVAIMKPAGGNLVRVAPKAGSGHGHDCQKTRTGKCCGSSGGCKCGGEIKKNAKSGGQQKKGTITIVVLDDEALNLNATKRMAIQAGRNVGLAREKLNVLTAATVEKAVEQILSSEVALIILDRKIGEGGRCGGEVVKSLLQRAPEKVDCAVMYSGSPRKVGEPIIAKIGKDRIFDKGKDTAELTHLIEHVLNGGSVKEWVRPSKEEFLPKEDEASKEPAKRSRPRPTWL